MGGLEPAENKRPSSELFLAPPALPIVAATRTETFRVQNIPLGYSTEHLKQLFKPQDRPGISIRSLAKNLQAVQNPYHGWQTATFTYTSADVGISQVPELIEDEDSDITIDGDFGGLTPLNVPSEPVTADIVAITGLTGNAFNTFASQPTRNWLRDYLPKDIPDAQVWLYGYEAEIDPSRPGDSLSDKVDDLKSKLSNLFSSRQSWPRNIVLVAHSLGCLVAQKTLIELSHSHPHIHSVVSAVFFGAPNNGLDDHAFATLVAPHDPYIIPNEFRADSEIIRSLQREFSIVARRMSILAFYETKDSPSLAKTEDGTWRYNVPRRIVKARDASLYSSMPTPCRNSDHFSMPKLRRAEESAYFGVVQFINKTVHESFEKAQDLDVSAWDKRVSVSSNHSAGGSTGGRSPGPSTAMTTPGSPDMKRDLTALQKSKYSIFPTSYVPHDGASRPNTSSAHSSTYSPPQHASPRQPDSPVFLPPPAMESQARSRLSDLAELDSQGSPSELPATPVSEYADRFELPTRPMSSREQSFSGEAHQRKMSFGRLKRSRTKSSPQENAVDRLAISWFKALHEDELAEIKRLLGEGKELINVQDKDCDNRTALHYAIENRSTSVFEYLMRRDTKPKLNIELVTSTGETPLHFAARCGNLHYAQSLLVKGARKEPRNNHGDTPLHLAAELGHAGVVAAFVELGANLNVKDDSGRTPTDIAVHGGFKDVVKRLQAGNSKATVSYPGLF